MGKSFWQRSAAAVAIGTSALIVGSLGVAAAANGGSLTLGHKNTATKTTTLKDSNGTPLSLKGSKTKPPLKVNSSQQVKHLNASLLSGIPASQLTTFGSVESAFPNTTSLSTAQSNATQIVSTSALAGGNYLVTGTAEILTNASSTGARCFIAHSGDADGTALQFFGAVSTGYGNATVSIPATVTNGTVLSLYCYTHDSSTQLFGATISAVRLTAFAAGTAPKPPASRSHTAHHGTAAAG